MIDHYIQPPVDGFTGKVLDVYLAAWVFYGSGIGRC